MVRQVALTTYIFGAPRGVLLKCWDEVGALENLKTVKGRDEGLLRSSEDFVQSQNEDDLPVGRGGYVAE